MAAACDLLTAELALDRIDAELAGELPAHLRACAFACARGDVEPPAPAVLRRASTLRAIDNARPHPLLADRAHALARMAWPIAIEDDPRVVAARAAPRTWDGLAGLTAARDAAAHDRLGAPFLACVHRLFGVTVPAREVAWPAPLAGWHESSRERFDDVLTAVASRWFAPPHGGSAGVEVIEGARARTFVVEPGRRVIVVAPPVTSPATAFVRLHEYGHAAVGLLAPRGVARAVDEAAASFAARSLAHPLEASARARRLQLATALDAIERGVTSARPTPLPPWALWHDPGAQAAYVEAETIADRWVAERLDLAAALAVAPSPAL